MSQETRINFTKEQINKTFIRQGEACLKCGQAMPYGFEVHHIDGDNSNVADDNCGLMHPRCHDSEQWKTLKLQKEKLLGQIDNVITQSLSEKGLAGAIIKELAGLIDKENSLQNQLYGVDHFDAPLDQRLAQSEAFSKAQIESYQEGFIEALKQFPTIMSSGNFIIPQEKKK